MAPPTPAAKGDPGELKRLEELSQKIVKQTLDDLRQVFAKAEKLVKRARPWPGMKLDAFHGGNDRLGALYSPATSSEIRREASRRELTAEEIEDIKTDALLSDGKVLADAEARTVAIERRLTWGRFAVNELDILHERGLAGAPVELSRSNSGSWSADPDQAVKAIIPDRPGAYLFAVQYAGFDYLSILAVERRSDGSTNVRSGSTFLDPTPDIRSAVSSPWLEENPSRSGSRAVLVYPLNPPAGGAKR